MAYIQHIYIQLGAISKLFHYKAHVVIRNKSENRDSKPIQNDELFSVI